MMRFCFLVLISWCWGLPVLAAAPDTASEGRLSQALATLSHSQDRFLTPAQAFHFSGTRDQHHLYIDIDTAEGYYLYRHKLSIISPEHVVLGTPTFSASQHKDDPTFGDVEIYQGHARITIPIAQALTSDPIDITVRYQGCAEAGLCYPPEQRTLSLDLQDTPATSTPATALAPPSHTEMPPADTPTMSIPQVLTLFIAGIGLAFTPCVLPMLPVVSGLIVGQQASRKRAFWLSGCYVAGMTLAYMGLGLCIGLLGNGLDLQARLQSAWVLVPMALLCVLCALWLFDQLMLTFPQAFHRSINALEARLRAYGALGLIAAGALSTLILSPCLSAPLAGVLVYLSTTGNVLLSSLGLAALGLGMGVPLVLCCGFGAGALPKAGHWMNTVKSLFGLMLLGVAVWLLARLLPPSFTLALWGMLALGTGRVLGAGMAWQTQQRGAVQLLGYGVFLWGVLCLIGAAGGGTRVTTPLDVFTSHITTVPEINASVSTTSHVRDVEDAIAHQPARPLLVSLYADWCTSCHTMESQVFNDPEVATLLKQADRIRLDVTAPDDAATHFLKVHQLLGPPSTLFFVQGREVGTLRLQGDASRNEMIQHLKAALSS